MLRPTVEERDRFRQDCSPVVNVAAEAMRNRLRELGIRSPFADDDTAWCDLADVAIRAALLAMLGKG